MRIKKEKQITERKVRECVYIKKKNEAILQSS